MGHYSFFHFSSLFESTLFTLPNPFLERSHLNRHGARPRRRRDKVIANVEGSPTGKWAAASLLAACLLVSAACSDSTQAAKVSEPPVVEVAQVQQKDVPIYVEWIGTLDGMVNADIKA